MVLKVVQETKYLGVIIQPDLKINTHIQNKVSKADRQLDMIKLALHNAPEQARLLAYTILYRLHMEYAASVWEPSLAYPANDIEMVHHCAIRQGKYH